MQSELRHEQNKANPHICKQGGLRHAQNFWKNLLQSPSTYSVFNYMFNGEQIIGAGSFSHLATKFPARSSKDSFDVP